MPKVYLIDDTAPNAFATGRDPEHASVAVTTGLLQKLDREELQGVIGHELAHVAQLRHPLQPARRRARGLHRPAGRHDGPHGLLGRHDGPRRPSRRQQRGRRRGRHHLRPRAHRGHPGALLREPRADGREPPARVPGRRHERRADPQSVRPGARPGQAGHWTRSRSRSPTGRRSTSTSSTPSRSSTRAPAGSSAPIRPSSTASTGCVA